jgi:polyhydroxyalkanoate synthesis regulator phasin
MKTKILVAAVVVLVTAGAIGGTVVLAQSNIPAIGTSLQTGTDQQTATDQCTQFRTSLAQHLGVTVDKLQQAFKDTAKEMIDQAVKNGKLTQQQADKLKQKIDSAQGKCFPLGAGILAQRGKVMAAGAMLKVGFDAAAKALSLTSDQLRSELKSGKSIADVAQAQKVDLQTVKTAVINAEKAAIDGALKNGKLTQQQADNMKSMIDKNGDNVLNHLFNQKARKTR